MTSMISNAFVAGVLGAGLLFATSLKAEWLDESQSCPSGYTTLAEFALCIHQNAGDVVAAAPKQTDATGAISARACPSGYWRSKDLCISLATGDVEESR